MWRGKGFSGGKWQEIEVVALDGKRFSSDSVREQAGQE